jgi:hypothetical protein
MNSTQQTEKQIHKISDIDGQIKLCQLHKQELIEEYFNHITNPLPHKSNSKTEYNFKYEYKVEGKCEMPFCDGEAFCLMYNLKKEDPKKPE